MDLQYAILDPINRHIWSRDIFGNLVRVIDNKVTIVTQEDIKNTFKCNSYSTFVNTNDKNLCNKWLEIVFSIKKRSLEAWLKNLKQSELFHVTIKDIRNMCPIMAVCILNK